MKQIIYRNSKTHLVFPICSDHAKNYMPNNILVTDYKGDECGECKQIQECNQKRKDGEK